ncbi:MAG: protein kinase [Myxococcaceae bacterium]|nr:protein kinase [Myxococcaceae bacterium]
MIRCTVCGRRLSDVQPLCSLHGPPSDASSAAGSSTASSTASLGVDGSAQPSATASLDPSVVGMFAGLGYRLERVLGRGGFATVYLAQSQQKGELVAIKVAHREQAEAARRLQREASALRAIGQPYVPAVYDRGALLGQFYLVMEYIPSQSLSDLLLQTAIPMPLARFAELSAAILRSLEAVHARGIVHRDLKPENIFIGPQGEAKLIDFELSNDESSPAEIVSTADAGTAEYISPEQCDGLSDADPRSDIYSVGALLYELLCGSPPFWGKSSDVREAHRSRRPAPLWSKTECPRELDAVLRRCLAKDRSRRFESLASLRGALDVALAQHRRTQSAPWQAQTRVADVPAGLVPARRPSVPTREKRTMGLVFFESRGGVAAVQQQLTLSGGQLLQTSGVRYVGGFGHDAGDNPARMALLAAQRLYATKLALNLLVDVSTVAVQARADGSRHVFSPLFSRQDQFPVGTDPAGVIVSASVLEVLPHLKVSPLDGLSKRYVLLQSASPKEPTTMGAQIAPVVGRDELLRELSESARRAFAEQPTLCTVVGEPGLGRTHLSSLLAQQLERTVPSGVHVLRLTAQQGLVGAVSESVPQLLRGLLKLPPEVPHDGGRALLGERLGAAGEQLWAAASFVLGWIDPDHPEVRRLSAAPGALRLAAARAAGEALRRCAERRPVAVVLDDAHLADNALLDALEYATLKEARARIWACVLVLPSFARARPGWGSRAAHTEQRTLEPLAPAHAMELARRLLLPVEHVPPAVLARLTERTEGNPRLLVELVRGLKRDGIVRRSERGEGYILVSDELEKLPAIPIVEWNARREIEALTPQLADHARMASVLGASFTVLELEELLQVLERSGAFGEQQLDATVGTQRLIDAGVLVRHRSGLVDFRHELLREMIYRSLSETRRKRLHVAAFEMYQRLPMSSERRLPRLALHAAESGEQGAAAAAYLALAERAVKGHSYLEAEAAFGRALANLPETDERVITAERGRGLMHFRLGRPEDALKDLRRARALARTPALARAVDGARPGMSAREAELMLDEATVLDWTRDFAPSALLVREVAAGCAETTGLLAARLAMSEARVEHRQGVAEACVRLGTEAATRAQRLGDEGYETRLIALMLVASDCAKLGRLDEAERYFEQTVQEAERHADLLHLGAATVNRALLWFARKDVTRLFADLRRAAQISREVGEPRMEYCTLVNMAESEYAIEELSAAVEHSERALVLARQLWGDSLELGARELLLARVALYRDDPAEAQRLAQRIRARLEEGADRQTDVDLPPTDRLLLEMVELRLRGASDTEWEQLAVRCSELAFQPHEELELLESRALAAHGRGEREQSRQLFESALKLSEDKPNLLSDRVARKAAQLFAE